MPTEKSDLLQGTLDMLILKIVASAPYTGTGSPSESARFPRKCCTSNRARYTPRCIAWKSAAGWRRNGANPKTAGRPSSTNCRQKAASNSREELNWHRLADAVGHILQTAG